MYLKKVEISNYRQLFDVKLNYQNNLTVLAGPNNSGKTTLISVLKGMFKESKLGFSYSDIPTHLSSAWVDKVLPVFTDVMSKHSKENGVLEIIKTIFVNEHFSSDYQIKNFEARIEVQYIPDEDDIQYFADYLMDLDESKNSFYFVYTFEESLNKFEKLLYERYDKIKSRIVDISNPGFISILTA